MTDLTTLTKVRFGATPNFTGFFLGSLMRTDCSFSQILLMDRRTEPKTEPEDSSSEQLICQRIAWTVIVNVCEKSDLNCYWKILFLYCSDVNRNQQSSQRRSDFQCLWFVVKKQWNSPLQRGHGALTYSTAQRRTKVQDSGEQRDTYIRL